MHLPSQDDIKVEYVKEAASLLRKSVVHVVSEDVQLELEDDDDGGLVPSEHGDDDDDDDHGGKGDGKAADDDQPSSGPLGQSSEADPSQRKHVSISYEKYTGIATMLIHHLRNHEDTAGEEDDGLSMDDVVTW